MDGSIHYVRLCTIEILHINLDFSNNSKSNFVGNGSLSGILKDVLVIELHSTRKLNLDLIDLPGIVGGSLAGEPTDMMTQTRELAESYINDPNNPHSLIVCVVSSRTERVRNSQAIEIVQRYNKCSSTIGVLTMVDLCKDSFRNIEDPLWELKERLNGTSQDMPNLDFGYVALKNRDTVQKHNLADVNTTELEWIRSNIPELENLIVNEDSKNSIGINSLIKKLLKMLDIYTTTKWAPTEIERLRTETIKTEIEIRNLGEEFPGELISRIVLGKLKSVTLPMYSYQNIKTKCHSIAWPQVTSSYVSEKYFEEKLNVIKLIKPLVLAFLDECLLSPILKSIDVIFRDQENQFINYHFSRYSTFRIILEKTLTTWARNIKANLIDNQILSKVTSELIKKIEGDNNLRTDASSFNTEKRYIVKSKPLTPSAGGGFGATTASPFGGTGTSGFGINMMGNVGTGNPKFAPLIVSLLHIL